MSISSRRPIRWLWTSLSLALSALAQSPYSSPAASADSGSTWSRVPGIAQDMLIVLVAGGVILIPFLLWIRFFRRRSHSHSKHHPGPHLTEAEEGEASDSSRHRHRRKRRRREHRSRNPTLAETGGLPPPRPDGQPPPV